MSDISIMLALVNKTAQCARGTLTSHNIAI